MTKNKFYFLPRILAISFIVFISLFALDVFGEPHWFLALLMHLIPSYILIILTIIAWRNEKIGGILFLITAVLAAMLLRSTVPIVLIPTLVIGVLFLVAKTNHRGNP